MRGPYRSPKPFVTSTAGLSRRSFYGEGVQKSVILAYVWFNLAAAQGDENAANSRDSLAAEMTREQIAEAQTAASGKADEIARAYGCCKL